jgi:uncharacterized protein (TIGR02599 family)
MVATVIVVILAGILISATDLTARSFSRTSAKIEQFSEARRGFEVMTRRLAEATLNTYFDYYDANGRARPTVLTRRVNGIEEANFRTFMDFVPATYGRQSELRFVSGPMTELSPASTADRPTHGVFFHAPIGEVEDRDGLGMLHKTLNSWGYFLEIADDREYIPSILQDLTEPRRRSRLLEFRQPTEVNPIYFPPFAGDPGSVPAEMRNWWFIDEKVGGIDKATDRSVRVVAENVIALIILPRLSRSDEIARAADPAIGISGPDDDRGVLCPSYFYDTALTADVPPKGIRLPPAQALGSNQRPQDVNPRNQLPPTVQVVMVALDENSAARLERATQGKTGFNLQLDEVFQRSIMLEDDPTSNDPDDGELHELEKKLIDPRLIDPALGVQPLTYRIFNTTVIIRGAKWSRAQAN